MKTLILRLKDYSTDRQLFLWMMGVIVFLWCCAIAFDSWWCLVPVFGALALWSILVLNLKSLFLWVFFLIPFSTEVQLGGGLATDLPTEPIIAGLAYLTILLAISQIKHFTLQVVMRPINLLILAHLVWITVATLFAQNQLIAFKFLLAKTWYVLPFYVLPFLLKWDKEDYKKLFDLLLLGVFIAAFYFFIQHAREGLSFQSRTNAGLPIFRNHVNYACLLVLSLPVIWYQMVTCKTQTPRYLLLMVAFLVFIYFSYARVAYVCILTIVLGYWMIKEKWTRIVLVIAVTASIFGAVQLWQNNRYLELAPTYSRAVTQERFNRLLEATYKGEDISSMERIYRWVAGVNMIREKPVVGFGPGNFYHYYQDYAVTRFQTYVSDNPDKSGIHNYYLMTMVEQGVVGFTVFILLIIVVLVTGQKHYHRLSPGFEKNLVMMACLVVITAVTVNLINDMYEVIKVGPFFFFGCFLICRYGTADKANPGDLKEEINHQH